MGAIWQQALETVSGLLADNAALCESVTLRGPRRLAATFRAKYTSCRTFCERPQQLSALTAALSAVAGGPVTLEFVTAPDEPTAAAAPRRAVPQRQRMVELNDHPMVRRATELFDARVTRIEEPEA